MNKVSMWLIFAMMLGGKICAAAVIAPSKIVPPFRVLSWNPLGKNMRDTQEFFPGTANDVRWRKVFETIQRFDADIVCLQEVSPVTIGEFQAKLGSKYTLAVHHQKGGNGGVAIFYRADRFSPLRDGGGHPVSHGAEVQSLDPSYPGAFAYACLFDKAAKTPVMINNWHISRFNNSSGTLSGQKQIKYILDLPSFKHFAGRLPTIIVGDFNTHRLEAAGMLSGYNRYIHDSWTCNTQHGELIAIDHAFFNNLVSLDAFNSYVGRSDNPYKIQSAHLACDTALLSSYSGLAPIHHNFPSDHLPMLMTFNYGASAAPAPASSGPAAAVPVDPQLVAKGSDFVGLSPLRGKEQGVSAVASEEFIPTVGSRGGGHFGVQELARFEIDSMKHIVVDLGDITDSKVDVIVNAANAKLQNGDGVCGVIFAAAGAKALKQEITKSYPGGGKPGEAFVTGSHELQQRGIQHIIHAVGPDCRIPEQAEFKKHLLRNAYQASFNGFRDLQLSSIAFPILSSGIYECGLELSMEIGIDVAISYLRRSHIVQDVHFVLYDQQAVDTFWSVMRKHHLALLAQIADQAPAHRVGKSAPTASAQSLRRSQSIFDKTAVRRALELAGRVRKNMPGAKGHADEVD